MYQPINTDLRKYNVHAVALILHRSWPSYPRMATTYSPTHRCSSYSFFRTLHQLLNAQLYKF